MTLPMPEFRSASANRSLFGGDQSITQPVVSPDRTRRNLNFSDRVDTSYQVRTDLSLFSLFLSLSLSHAAGGIFGSLNTI